MGVLSQLDGLVFRSMLAALRGGYGLNYVVAQTCDL